MPLVAGLAKVAGSGLGFNIQGSVVSPPGETTKVLRSLVRAVVVPITAAGSRQ